jgi:hypothetical protein
MKWTHIMLHHSAGHDSATLDVDNIRRFHIDGRGWQDIGYHFVVELVEGEHVAIMGRPLYLLGAHCPGWNERAIGIVLVGDFTKAAPSPALVACAARLVAGLCSALEIPVSNILEHKDAKPTECPGAETWGLVVEAVEKLL